MSEFRRDPFTGRWRILAEGRAARPNQYGGPPAAQATAEDCPFCEGHEDRTPPEEAAVRPAGLPPNGPGWTVRSFPNKFPSVAPETRLEGPAVVPPFERGPGRGFHEVIVEAPAHAPDLPYLSDEQAHTLFRFLRDRVRALSARPGIGNVLLFENRGPESGGTLPHPHAQIMATEPRPALIDEEVEAFRRGNLFGGDGCRLEAVVDAERRQRSRIVGEGPEFVAFAPFASEYPYEVWFVPRRHARSFVDASDREVDALARCLPAVLRAIDRQRGIVSYNWFVHGHLPTPGSWDRFHWHLEVAPRLVRADGYELGSGVAVNPVAPERVAEELRPLVATAFGGQQP